MAMPKTREPLMKLLLLIIIMKYHFLTFLVPLRQYFKNKYCRKGTRNVFKERKTLERVIISFGHRQDHKF